MGAKHPFGGSIMESHTRDISINGVEFIAEAVLNN